MVVPLPPSTPDACDSTMVLDAVTTLRGEMFFFKDRYQMQSTLKSEYQNSVRQMFQHENLAFVLSFFWRSLPNSRTPQQSLITSFWPTAPVNIDAAFESRHSDKIYFFKGTENNYCIIV